MSKRGSAFWDMLPLVLIVAVVCGSLFFVDFQPTGMAVSCSDVDGDGYLSADCMGVICESGDHWGTNDVEHINPVTAGDFIFWQQDSGDYYEIWGIEIGDTEPHNENSNHFSYATGRNALSPTVYYDGSDYYLSWISRTNSYGDRVYYTTESSSWSVGLPIAEADPSEFMYDNPVVSDEYIVYEQLDWDDTIRDIQVYDLDTSTTELVEAGNSLLEPDVYGDYVVFKSNPFGGFYDAAFFEIGDYSPSLLTYTFTKTEDDPKIYADYMVWTEIVNGNEYNIVAFTNIPSATYFFIANETGVDEKEPAIHRNKIVWSDDREGDFNIYMYDLDSETEYIVTTNGDNHNPDIGDRYIVWEHGTGVDSRVQWLDIDFVMSCSDDTVEYDCDNLDVNSYPGATELCDGVDNDCDGTIDESCTGVVSDCGVSINYDSNFDCFITASETCELAQVLSNSTTDFLGVNISASTYMELQGLDSDKCVYYSNVSDSFIEYTDDLVQSLLDAGSTQAEIDQLEVDANDDQRAAVGLEQTCKFIPEDLTAMLTRWKDGTISTDDWCVAECTGDFDYSLTCPDEGTTANNSCLIYSGSWYNVYENATVSSVTNIETVHPRIEVNVTCNGSSLDFEIYPDDYSAGDTPVTTLSATGGDFLDDDNDGVNDSYYFSAEWNISSFTLDDGDYVFVAKTGDEGVESSDLRVCGDLDNCSISTNSSSGEEGDLDCASQWDCSAVDWSECSEVTLMKTRDLDLCVQPVDQECYDDIDSYPDDSVSCVLGSEDDGEEDDEEDVPIFGWFNMLIVIFVLIGYYWYRK